jgi:hypothetical protein
MENLQKKSNLYFVLAIIIVAFILTVPFWIYGIPKTSDSIRHYIFASAVSDAIANGSIYVQGEPNINYGYGGFALRLYPVVSYYSLAIAHFITNDWFNAAFLFFWFWMSFSGIGAYFLAKEWLEAKFAFIGATLYMLEPYHNAQINNSYANAEFVAGCILTFCLLFITRVIKYGKISDILGLALFYGFLILSHIPITIIGSFCLLIYSIFYLANAQDWKKSSLKLFAGAFLGILGGSFHLVRLITENQWSNHSSSQYLTDNNFSYQLFFVDIRGIFFPSDLILFNLVILIAPSALIVLYKSSKETKRVLIPIIVITLFSIFMSTSFSQKIWENIGTLQKIQFPWRWLTIASIGYGIIIAAGISSIQSIFKEKKLVVGIWMCLCIFTSSYFTYSYVIGANLLDSDYFLIKEETFNNKVKFGAIAPHHKVWQTIWAKESAFTIEERVVAEGRIAEILNWRNYHKTFQINPGKATNARLAVSYYPHWKAKINGVEVDVSKTDDGAILIPVPPEEALVELSFVEPNHIVFCLYLSGSVWLIIFVGLFFLNFQIKNRNETVLESQ